MRPPPRMAHPIGQPWLVASCAVASAPTPGERDLAEPDHPALAGHERERQEDDAERDALEEQGHPEARQEERHEADDDERAQHPRPSHRFRATSAGGPDGGLVVGHDRTVERAADAFALVDPTAPEDVVHEEDGGHDERDARDRGLGEGAARRDVVLDERAGDAHQRGRRRPRSAGFAAVPRSPRRTPRPSGACSSRRRAR